jgi:ddrB-like ParB superfamily domain
VVEAGAVKTSQDPGYDARLQPRQHDRAASEAQVRAIAGALDPDRLGYSAEADRGAPSSARTAWSRAAMDESWR